MRNSIQKIQKFKDEGKKITMLTAYDYSTAKYIDEAGCDIILVGDSVGHVVLGYESTTQVDMTDMLVFTGAVSRAVENALLVSDLPFGSFQVSLDETARNAIELIKKGANAVKIEGGTDYIADTVRHLVQNGIPVMGHLGFTPMSINTIGGHKVQGKDSGRIFEILSEAKKLQDAGAFAVVLEMVPKEGARFISKNLKIPTIGIGAGIDCDGQVLVSDDVFGKYDGFKPKFARRYSSFKDIIINVTKAYCADVEGGKFPTDGESFNLSLEEIEKLENYQNN